MDAASLSPEDLERLSVYRSDKSKAGPNSRYLGGEHHGGPAVERLAKKWQKFFKVKHAIPCNSATSGLLAACMAAGIGPRATVWTTPFSMSATAACAKVLGAHVKFIDIEGKRYGINHSILYEHVKSVLLHDYVGSGLDLPDALIVANILGHPAHLKEIKRWCDQHGVVMVEDNAQAPLATEDGVFAGTIGDIGVFSLNVHKHFQCGEGGVVVTNSDIFATRVYDAINHGELRSDDLDEILPVIGLNLRMTESTARMAWQQMNKAPQLVKSRRDLARNLSAEYTDDWVMLPPREDNGCVSSFYIWAGRMKPQYAEYRDEFVYLLRLKNAPFKAGYSPLLTKIFKSDDDCPVAEAVESELVTFETCAWDPTPSQIHHMGDIITWASREIIRGSLQKSA